jgi:hypothetical protein
LNFAASSKILDNVGTFLQSEKLKFENLQTKSTKSYTKDTQITYKVAEEMVAKRGISNAQKKFSKNSFSKRSKTSIHFISRLNNIENLEEFKLFFSLGYHGDNFASGSFFKAKFSKEKNHKGENLNDKNFKELGYLLSGMFGFASDTILEKERMKLEGEESEIYWYASPMELLCVNHLSKLRKILSPQDLSTMDVLFDNSYLGQKTAALTINFKFVSQGENEKNGKAIFKFDFFR